MSYNGLRTVFIWLRHFYIYLCYIHTKPGIPLAEIFSPQISIVTGLFWKINCAENSNTDMTIMMALKHLPPAFSSIRSVKNKQNEHLFLVF